MNTIKLILTALILGAGIQYPQPVKADPTGEVIGKSLIILGGTYLGCMASIGGAELGEELGDMITAQVKKHFYKELYTLELLEEDIHSFYGYGCGSTNNFIKEDYVEQNYATVDHSFLDIFSSDHKNKLLTALLELEASLDACAKSGYDSTGNKLLGREEKNKVVRKTVQVIKEIKAELKQPKRLSYWLPKIGGILGLVAATATGYVLYQNGTLTQAWNAFKYQPQDTGSFPNFTNGFVKFNANVGTNGYLVPDSNGPFEFSAQVTKATIDWAPFTQK